MNWFLLGLQWAGIAFGIFMLMLIALLFAYWLGTLIYGQPPEADNAGAPEGDDRHFRKY